MVTKRHYLTIKRPNSSLDSRGQSDGDTTLLSSVPAELRTVNGTEARVAEQRGAYATHVLTFRADSAVPVYEHDYAELGARRFDFVAIDESDPVDLVVTVAEQRPTA